MSEAIMKEKIQIGVFICDCGGRIGEVIDTARLQQQISQLNRVAYVSHEAYPCSKDGQERMRKAIVDQSLDRILLAGCAPRLVEKLFRKTVKSAGIDPDLLQIVDIREQVAYIHTDPKIAMQKAVSLIEMGVARLTTTSKSQTQSSPVIQKALVIGSGLSSMTTALVLAEQNIPVLFLEETGALAGEIHSLDATVNAAIAQKCEQIIKHPLIEVLFNARILEVLGHPGEYKVRVHHGDDVSQFEAGSIIVNNGTEMKVPGTGRWYDRLRVKSQFEFEAELKQANDSGKKLALKDVVMVFCADENQVDHCSRICCNAGIRQAIRVKELNPETNVTVLFREIYLGGIGEDYEAELVHARSLGVTFFRYRREAPPTIGETIDVIDTLTGEPVRLFYDRVVLTMPVIPQESTKTLSALLSLPLDEAGFLAEPRVRLKPDRYLEPGIFVLGSAQQPADSAEALFQAYLIAARVQRFLKQSRVILDTPAASIDPNLCTGCGNCPQVCPTSAIRLEKREGILSLSEVDGLKCIGCGNCVVVCPVKAITLPGWDNVEIPAQISAALRPTQDDSIKVIALTCEWSAYGAADMAGARHLTYPADVLIMRMNCSARFDPYHILWAFLNGADGVFLGACPVGECHYGIGNLYAQERVTNLQTELKAHGINPRRLRLDFITVDDGDKFSRDVTEFVKDLKTEIIKKEPIV
jgi:heterodisulfide reductase subunit A